MGTNVTLNLDKPEASAAGLIFCVNDFIHITRGIRRWTISTRDEQGMEVDATLPLLGMPENMARAVVASKTIGGETFSNLWRVEPTRFAGIFVIVAEDAVTVNDPVVIVTEDNLDNIVETLKARRLIESLKKPSSYTGDN